MESLIHSCLLVFISEMGDKTQLLALILAARYKRPWVILSGVFVATVLNHFFAAGAGALLAAQFSPHVLKWVLALTFFAFAVWILIPDKEGEIKAKGGAGVFVTTVISFFLAEMGDKTQFATIALGAKYHSVLMVTLGSTFGMLFANAPAVFFGDKLLKKIPMKYVRFIASLLFALFGLGILLEF